MKFVIAPDSFKGGLSAEQAANAMATGIRRVFPTAEYTLVPMADGGEGTVAALVAATGGHLVSAAVHDPLDRPIMASYGLLGTSNTAVIEMAAASGLQFVDPQTQSPPAGFHLRNGGADQGCCCPRGRPDYHRPGR